MKLTSKPTFVASKIFNDKLVAAHKIKETLNLNRPAYVGMCILDLGNTLMYDSHYNYIEKKYNDKAKPIFTDTDSLAYEIVTEDAYKDFWTDKDKFDNMIGKFKDGTSGIPSNVFIGLRSKMYSYLKDTDECRKTAKSEKKNVIKNDIKHGIYKNVLFNNKQATTK